MSLLQASSLTDVTFVGYLVVFGAASAASFISAKRVTRIEDPDTRRGLVALCLTSGGWALAHTLFLLVPTLSLKHFFYLVGLVAGLSAVGAWLYFCSAYTNRSLHRNTLFRRVALAVFLGLVAVKLTNPFHNLYFTAELVTAPFPHLAVTHHLFHWVVMGLSYALALVGAFILLEHFMQVSYDTTPLLALVGITGLPIAFDLVGFATPYLIDITYEPVGVAIFAVGVGFVYLNAFQTIQLAGSHDDPLIIVRDDDRIRDYNQPAREMFPELEDETAIGEPLWAILPDVAEALETKPALLECDRGDGTRYYRITESPFTAREASLGRLFVFTDVTDREQYRRELEQQNDRLDEFASVVSHDLRNPLHVASARVELARDECDSDHLDTAGSALERMETLIEDVLALARHGQLTDDLSPVSLAAIATESWEMIDAPEANLVIEDDLDVMADATRLRQLLENLFRNAVDHGGRDVTIRVGSFEDIAGFYVADDGVGIPEDEREEVFEAGYTTANDGTGFGLAIVDGIAAAHGWSITITASDTGGTRVEITDIDRA